MCRVPEYHDGDRPSHSVGNVGVRGRPADNLEVFMPCLADEASRNMLMADVPSGS